MSLNVVIAEDEPLSRSRLQRFLSKIGDIDNIYAAMDGEQALELIHQHQPELVVLDINMPKMTGLEVARAIDTANLRPPAIIFTTAYDEHALDAFKVNAFAYLMKPIQESELLDAVKRAGEFNRVQAIEISSVEQQSLMLKRSSTIESLKLNDVIFFKATEKIVLARMLSGEENIVSFSLKQLEEQLSPAFVRVHRHTLVNSHFLKRLEKNADEGGRFEVFLDHVEEPFSVSRRQVSMLKKIFTDRHL